MKPNDVYVDMDGCEIALGNLDAEERKLVARIRRRAGTHPDWTDFDNYWLNAVQSFYAARGLSPKAIPRTAAFRVAQDLSSRLGIAAGLISPPDLYEELQGLILDHYPSREAFCKATGMRMETLNQVLAGRKELSVGQLDQALSRIGFRLRCAPQPPVVTHQRTG